jgi:hypothetical protein
MAPERLGPFRAVLSAFPILRGLKGGCGYRLLDRDG